jgi:hypothetical protein
MSNRLIGAFSLSLAVVSSTAWAGDYKVESIEAFLVLGQSGKLSANLIVPTPPIDFWNTGIGEGGAGEWTSDLLVIGHFVRAPEAGGTTAKITVRDHDSGKVLYERKAADLTFAEGASAAKAFVVNDIQCTNLDVAMSIGGDSRTVNLPFACGE